MLVSKRSSFARASSRMDIRKLTRRLGLLIAPGNSKAKVPGPSSCRVIKKVFFELIEYDQQPAADAVGRCLQKLREIAIS